ncbi:MAG: hypothetical protein Q8Q02_06940 [Nocardioides sp.]|nr:hypothetical protein [Nocardioides sp.]
MSRFSPLLLIKGVALAVVLVLAIDYASFAATGQSLVLGKLNKANQVTTIARTNGGPALSLVTKPGSPPFKVNRPIKVAKLNADRLDGLHSSQLARRPRVTAHQTTACTSLPSVTNVFQKITDIATFTKSADNTLVRLDLAGRVRIESGSGGTGTIFELRIGDAPTTLGAANMLVRSAEYATHVQRPLFGVFRDLPAGTHTVSIWVRVTAGTGTTAYFDPGCWNSANVNHLLVTEF